MIWPRWDSMIMAVKRDDNGMKKYDYESGWGRVLWWAPSRMNGPGFGLEWLELRVGMVWVSMGIEWMIGEERGIG